MTGRPAVNLMGMGWKPVDLNGLLFCRENVFFVTIAAFKARRLAAVGG